MVPKGENRLEIVSEIAIYIIVLYESPDSPEQEYGIFEAIGGRKVA